MTETLAPPRATSKGLLPIVLVGQFMAVLDVSVVNVAVPTIQSDLNAAGWALQLIVAGYTISYAVLLVTGARLGGLGGHSRVFQYGLGLFTASSLACGLAGSTGQLIAFRLVQGVGAALMVPQVFSLIQRTFTGAARARALSLYAAVVSGGAAAGQVLGGVLVSADLAGTGWRPVFLINVPVGAALLVVGRRLLPRDRGERSRTLDPAGVVLLSAAVFALVLPLVLGREVGWAPWTWLSLAGSVGLFGAFAAVQVGLTRRGGRPLIPARVLAARGLLPGALGILFSMAAYGGFLFATGLHLQHGLGYPPAHAGLIFVPGALAFAFSSLNWRRIPPRWHRRMVPVGLALAAVGYAGQGLVLRHADSIGFGYWAANVAVGIGFGAVFSPLLTIALTHVAAADAADASGVLVTVTQLAQVIGVATFGTLYLSLTPEKYSIAATNALLALVCLTGAAATLWLPRPVATPARPRPGSPG